MKSVYFALLFEATSQYIGQGGGSGGDGYGGGYGYSRSRGSGHGADPYDFGGGYGEYGVYGGNGGGYSGDSGDYGYSGGYGYYGHGYGYGSNYGIPTMNQQPGHGYGYGYGSATMNPQTQPMSPQTLTPGISPWQNCFNKQYGTDCLLYSGPFPLHTHGICSGGWNSICIEPPGPPGPPTGPPPTGGACQQDTDCGYEQVCTNNVCELGELDLPDFRKTEIFHTHAKDGDKAWRDDNDLDELDPEKEDDEAILELIHFSGSFRTYLKDHEKMAELINESDKMREIIEDLAEEGEDSKYAKICAEEIFPKSSQDTSSRSKATTFKKAAEEWFDELEDDWDQPRKYLKKGKCPEGLNTNLYEEARGSGNCEKDSNWTGDKPLQWKSYSEKLDDYYQDNYVLALEAARDKFILEREEVRKALDDFFLFISPADPAQTATYTGANTVGWMDPTGVYTDLQKGLVSNQQLLGDDVWKFTGTIPTLTGIKMAPLATAYWKLMDTPDVTAVDTADKFDIEKMIAAKDKNYDDGDMQKKIRETNVYGGCDDPEKSPPYLLDEWRTFACDNDRAKFLRTFEDPEVLEEIRGLVQAVLSAKSNMRESVLGKPVLDDPTGETNFESNSMVRSIHNGYERKIYEVSQTTTTTTQPTTTWPQPGLGAPNPFGYGPPNQFGVGAPNPFGVGPPNPYGGYGPQSGYGPPPNEFGNQYFNGPNNHSHHYY